MHHCDLQLQRAQTRRRFAGEQAAPDHHHGFLDVGHLPQRKSVADRAQINHVPKIDARDRRPHWPTAHRKARLCELDAFAVA